MAQLKNLPLWSLIARWGMAWACVMTLIACAAPRTPTAATLAPTPVGQIDPTVSPAPTLAPSTTTRTSPPDTLTPSPAPPTPTPTATPTTRATVTSAPPALVLNSPVNIRSGPGVAYTVIGNLEAEARAEVIGRDSTSQWLVIVFTSAKTGQGWVAQKVGAYTGDVAELPVVTAPPLPPTRPPPTATTAPKPVVGSHGLTGQLTLCNPKTNYAIGERICFNQRIVNTSNAFVSYGILGVLAVSANGGPTQFQTSWSGDLGLNPGCVGPTDRCGGPWEDGMRIATPGAYLLYLQICYSPINTCLAGGEWESLAGGLAITVNG